MWLTNTERVHAEVERKSLISLRLMIRATRAIRRAKQAKSFKYHGGRNS